MSNWQIRQDGAPAGSGAMRSWDGIPDLLQKAVFRQDSAIDTVALSQQLEEMEAEVYRADYPDVKTPQIVPLRDDGDPGAETHAFADQDGNAEWGLMSEDGRSNDAPSQSIRRDKDAVHYYSFVHAFGYTINDIRRASMANVPLSTEQPLLARESWEETFEDVVAKGYGGTKLRGLLDYPGVSQSNDTSWEAITDGDALVKKVYEAFLDQMQAVQGIEGLLPNRLVLPLSVYTHLLQTPYVIEDTGIEVKKTPLDIAVDKIRRIVPDFQAIWWRKCNKAKPGDAARHRALLYRLDPRVLYAKSSVAYEMLPVQPDGYGFKVPCHARTAGVVIRRPLAVKYIDMTAGG